MNLRNLKLKQTALDEMSHLIPLEIVQGSIGHIKLKVNFKQLIKSPIVVEVSDVVIMVRSRRSCAYDERRESEGASNNKRKQLKARMAKQAKGFKALKKSAKASKKSRRNKKDEKIESPMEQQGALTKLIGVLKSFHSSPVSRKLIETVTKNLTISISNIHLRYEDLAVSNQPIFVGMTLKSLQVFSCDDQWERIHMSSSKGPCYKVSLDDDCIVARSTHLVAHHLVCVLHNHRKSNWMDWLCIRATTVPSLSEFLKTKRNS